MLMDYHAMTMNESKDSYQRRLQFKVICAIIAGCCTYTVLISGILLTIEPFDTTFPGGKFCYKHFERDYATSMGIGRLLRKDVLEAFPKEDDEVKGISVKDREKIIADKVYHVYLDNPAEIAGAHTRWLTGILVSDDVEKMSYCDPLFEKNSGIMKEKELNKHEPDSEKGASDLFYQGIYQSIALPSAKSLAIKFPFSDGFSSILAFSFKVMPKMWKLAAEKGEIGNTPVVISLCSERDQECTHYIPLLQGIDFHAGLPSTEYHKKSNDETFDLLKAMKSGLRVIFPFLKPYIDTSSTKSSASDGEL